ncbi:hypothetical protein [Rhodoferax sp. TH121]|uniref:hypothetical protein n=1 Tax=Rhodoferax sp. TH121 TaxID=2022803 RepID=UPI001140689C|nr:hypothetical protein [Rhodoferax sp. TH121]
MTSRYRRIVAIRIMPAALLSMLNLAANGEVAKGAHPASTLLTTMRDLKILLEVFAVLARTRNFDEVMRQVGELSTRPRRTELADWGAAYLAQHPVVSEFMIHRERTAPGQRQEKFRQVVAIQAVLRPNTVRLSDLEATFGAWYRDPPDGDKVSLASAYFNAKLIHPKASYFLLATTGAGYEETLSKSEYAQTLVATWSDDRYSTKGRPW